MLFVLGGFPWGERGEAGEGGVGGLVGVENGGAEVGQAGGVAGGGGRSKGRVGKWGVVH